MFCVSGSTARVQRNKQVLEIIVKLEAYRNTAVHVSVFNRRGFTERCNVNTDKVSKHTTDYPVHTLHIWNLLFCDVMKNRSLAPPTLTEVKRSVSALTAFWHSQSKQSSVLKAQFSKYF